MRRPQALALLAAGLLLVSFAPRAAAAKPARVGLGLTGSPVRPVHDAIAATLRHHGYDVVDVDAGDGSDEAAAAAIKEAHLPAAIVGEVRDGKRLGVRVYGAAGDVVGKGTWTEKGGANRLAASVGKTLWMRVGDALTSATSASGDDGAASASDDESEPAAKRAEADESADGEGAPSGKPVTLERTAPDDAAPASAATALDLGVGMRIFSRNLTFSPSGTSLRNYSLSGRSGLGLAGSWYPAAPYRSDWLANLGIGGAVEWLPGLDSQTSSGASYPTTAADVLLDVRYRLLLRGVGQLAFAVGGGQQSYVFRSDGAAQRSDIDRLADVQYSYMRFGVDGRFTLPANISILASAGYRYVFGAGSSDYLIQQSSYIPGSTVVAFDAGAGVGYRFLTSLEARAGFDLRRYQFSGGTNTAMVTSATDQYTAFWLELAVLLDGAGAAGPHAAVTRPRGDDE